MEFQGANFQNVGSWLVRLARLDLTVFDDVKDDATATVPALVVAVAASFLSGLGSWLWWTFEDFGKGGEVFVKSFIVGSILQVGVWFLWVYVAAMILSRGLGAAADLNRLIRTMGLAFAPMAIAVLMLISFLAVPFGAIAVGAAVVLSYVAIQAATGAQPQQVMLANALGFVIFAIVLGILANVAEGDTGTGLAPGLFFVSLD